MNVKVRYDNNIIKNRRKFVMPKTRFESIVFSAMMSVAMAYGMEMYNIAREMGGMSNAVFITALQQTSYMCLIVFVISSLFGNKIGQKIAFRHVTPGKDNPFFITLMVSGCTVAVMCPTMSLVATVLFSGIEDSQFIANWFAKIARNFPMAVLWQLFFAGPVVRLLFRKFFREKQAVTECSAVWAEREQKADIKSESRKNIRLFAG